MRINSAGRTAQNSLSSARTFNVAVFPAICLVFVGFSLNSTTICHLENAEILDISIVEVLPSSEAHYLGDISVVYVCQRKAVVVSMFSISDRDEIVDQEIVDDSMFTFIFLNCFTPFCQYSHPCFGWNGVFEDCVFIYFRNFFV